MRVISFAPSLTEMVYAINCQDRLVGVTSWCSYPPEAKSKTVVGDYASPNWERMASLKPDLVILVGSEKSPMLSRLKAMGIPAAVFHSETADDILGDIKLLGKMLGGQAAADSLVFRLRLQMDSLSRSVASIPSDQRPRVFAEISDRPLMTGGDQSFLGQLIAMAGGRNIFGNLPQDYAAVNPENVFQGRPDIILIMHPGATPSDVRDRLGWSAIPAVKSGRIVSGLDLDLLMRPGPRFTQAAWKLHQVFYGQR